jgi:hypothetical protein
MDRSASGVKTASRARRVGGEQRGVRTQEDGGRGLTREEAASGGGLTRMSGEKKRTVLVLVSFFLGVEIASVICS